MIDTLEPRVLLAATTSYDAATQILRVFGTARRDTIEFARTDPTKTVEVRINGNAEVFDDPIRLLSISCGDGADLVIFGQVSIPAVVKGGGGPDSLSGGNGNDTIDGGGGSDYIFGRQGNDQLAGGLQNDILFGSTGDDLIFAQSGLGSDDTISGGAGIDTVDYSFVTDDVQASVGADLPGIDEDDDIFGDIELLKGGPGNDTLNNATRRGIVILGGDGNDTINGGSGNDTLAGEAGLDVINGFGGRDAITSNDGEADTVDGGSGGDQNSGDALDTVINVP